MNFVAYAGASVLATALAAVQAAYEPEPWRQFPESKLNQLILVNLGYSLLFLIGKITQWFFFGKLRVIESQAVYERLLTYVLFKVVFLGAIVQPELKEYLLWTSWFAVFGFLKTFCSLARDRLEYLTFSPDVPTRIHVKLLILLTGISLSNGLWFYVCILVLNAGFVSLFLFLAYESVMLFLDLVQTYVKYALHFWERQTTDSAWDRGTYVYMAEFVTDVAGLSLTLGHQLHVWIFHGLIFNWIDFFLFLNMRATFNNLRKRINGFRNFRNATSNLDARFPDATAEELARTDRICIFCRDEMATAKRLPCSHLFHLQCLRSWLERNQTCPTCRASVDPSASIPSPTAPPVAPPNIPMGIPPRHESSVWRITTERWNFLPRFSLEVVRSTIPSIGLPLHPMPTPNVVSVPPHPHPHHSAPPIVSPDMVGQVADMFPHISRQVISEDLSRTHSVEDTVNNLLEGFMHESEPSSSRSSEHSSVEDRSEGSEAERLRRRRVQLEAVERRLG